MQSSLYYIISQYGTKPIVGFFIIVVFGLMAMIFKLNKRINKLLEGKDAKSLEDTLVHIINEIVE
ncbi:MAG: hypothetical protein R3B65_03710 [Candidatus Paceibacterota bacterium]